MDVDGKKVLIAEAEGQVCVISEVLVTSLVAQQLLALSSLLAGVCCVQQVHALEHLARGKNTPPAREGVSSQACLIEDLLFALCSTRLAQQCQTLLLRRR